MAPPSNFVVFSSIITKFSLFKEYDKFFSKSANKIIWVTLLRKYEIIFCFRLMYPLKFWNSSFLDGFGRNLAQKVSSDSKSETILQIRDQYQVHIGHSFVIFPFIKKCQPFLNDRVDITTNQATEE